LGESPVDDHANMCSPTCTHSQQWASCPETAQVVWWRVSCYQRVCQSGPIEGLSLDQII